MAFRKKPKTAKRNAGSTQKWVVVLFVLLFAGIGSYFVFKSQAADDCGGLVDPQHCAEINSYTDMYIYNKNSNPALSNSCTTGQGLDIALLVDTSGSMYGEPLAKARAAMRTFITELSGTKTYFAIGTIDGPQGITPFTNNQARALAQVDTGTANGGSGASHLGDLRGVTNKDPRPNSPNLIIVLTDGQITHDLVGARAVQQAGTRILAIGFGNINITALKLIAGPNVDTGSIWTSDVITSGRYDGMGALGSGGGSSATSPESLESVLRKVAVQCKGTGSGHGDGSGGAGTGTDGRGQGQSPNTGPGGGGTGGSSANKQTSQPNSLPSPSSQGTAKQTVQEPSPFFDGKEFKPGSDPDKVTLGAITVGSRKAVSIWVALVVLLAASVAVWRFWWRPKRT